MTVFSAHLPDQPDIEVRTPTSYHNLQEAGSSSCPQQSRRWTKSSLQHPRPLAKPKRARQANPPDPNRSLAKKVRHNSRPPRRMLFLAENASPVSHLSLPAEHLNILPAWHRLLFCPPLSHFVIVNKNFPLSLSLSWSIPAPYPVGRTYQHDAPRNRDPSPVYRAPAWRTPEKQPVVPGCT
jgi:hypothetical protein